MFCLFAECLTSRSVIFYRFFRIILRVTLPSVLYPSRRRYVVPHTFVALYLAEDTGFPCSARYHSLSPFTPSIAISRTACLSISSLISRLSLSLALFLSLNLSLSCIHSFALIEYNSYVITAGRHPMSISSGMHDERFSLSRLGDLN